MPEGPAPTRPTPLIDIHAHFLTEDYVAAAHAGGHAHPDGMPGWSAWSAWSAENHLTLMDQWDVAKAVLSISSPGVHFGDDAAARALARQVNRAGTAVVAARPDRFGHFASLPLPDVDGSLAEAAYALDELGSDGVTVETSTTGVYLGDPRYEPLWAELDQRSAVVFVHPTSPPCHEEVSLGRPRPMDRTARSTPSRSAMRCSRRRRSAGRRSADPAAAGCGRGRPAGSSPFADSDGGHR